MSAALLLLTIAACFPRMDLPSGDADGGGVGGGEGSADGGDEGAGGGGDEGAGEGGGDDGDDGDAPVAPSLSGASPGHGSNAGGRRVTVSGTDLGEATRVWFGEREATVLSSADDHVEVEVPASPAVVGPVSIRVQTAGGEDSLAGAFQYWDDASGEAVTVLRARAIEGWDGSGWWSSFQALAWNTHPMDAWSTDTQAGASSCAATYSISNADTPPSSLDIDGDLGTFRLEPLPDSAGLYYEADSPTVAQLLGTRHSVGLAEGGAWPAYTVSDGIGFPDTLALHTPDPDEYESHDLAEFAVEWDSQGADRVLVGFFDASSDALVICALPNSGAFGVPADTFDGFVPSESAWWGQAWVMQVVLLAYKDTASVLDFNNGQLRAQGGVGLATWVRVEDSWL